MTLAPFRFLRGLLKKRILPAKAEAPAVSALARVIADLDLLNRNTEADFLKIGGKLGEFIETVNLISGRLTALVEMISGAHRAEQFAGA